MTEDEREDPTFHLGMRHGLSAESIRACKMGAFEVQDLVDFLPRLAPAMAVYGEHDVVQACQDARMVTGNASRAIDLVVRFFAHDPRVRAAS